MPSATRKFCDFPGCSSGPPDENLTPTPYVTPQELRTREEVSEDLRNHVETAHTLRIRLAEADAKRIEMEAPKLEMEVRKIEADTARALAECEPQQPTEQAEHQHHQPVSRGFIDKRDLIPRPKIELHVGESD